MEKQFSDDISNKLYEIRAFQINSIIFYFGCHTVDNFDIEKLDLLKIKENNSDDFKSIFQNTFNKNHIKKINTQKITFFYLFVIHS